MFTKTLTDKIWVIDKDGSRVEMSLAEFDMLKRDKAKDYSKVAAYIESHRKKEPTGVRSLKHELTLEKEANESHSEVGGESSSAQSTQASSESGKEQGGKPKSE